MYVMLLPGLAETGPKFVTLKSAPEPDAATPMVTVAELFAALVSFVAVPTVTVSVMIVPAAVPAATV